MHPSILILTATELEQRALKDAVEGALRVALGPRSIVIGRLTGHEVALLETGIGAVNTAQALTAALEAITPRLVLQTGIGGAYTRSGLEVGDLAIASEEIHGDLGVITPDGWRGAEEIGIPVVQNDGDHYNRFPIDADIASKAERILSGTDRIEGCPQTASGPFVTVQTCSGTRSRGDELAERFGAICENMEGAAAAHICRLYDVAFLEIRAISNPVTDRDPSTWDIPLASTRAQQAVLALIEEFEI